MASNEDIIRKIKALLAKAASTEHEAEADAFMCKAQELLEKHQMNPSMLSDEDIVHMQLLEGSDKGDIWRYRLLGAVARLYGCEYIHHHRNGRWQLEITGYESSVKTTELMYPFIVEQCRVAAKKISQATGEPAINTVKPVAAALIIRINKLCRERDEKQAAPTEAGRNALVLMGNVNAAYMERNPDVVFKNYKLRTTASAKSLADNISLNRQVGGQQQGRLK